MKLVYYCPGDSIGSPAHLTPHAADIQFVKDSRMVSILSWTEGRPSYLSNSPHIGGECNKCKRRKDENSSRTS